MAEAIQVPASGGIPPLPPGGSQGQGVGNHGQPPAPFVPSAPTFNTNPLPTPPAAQGAFTEEQVQARIAAALAAQSQPAPTAAAPAGEAFDFGGVGGDDPLLDSMSSLFNSTAAAGGVDIERALGKAVQTGNVEFIDEAYLREKGGANAAHLIQIGKSLVNHIATVTSQAKSAAFEAAGGEAQWNTAVAAFNAKAPAHLKLITAKMMDSGNVQQIAAAAKMIVETAGGSGLLPSKPGLAVPTQGGQGGQALNKLDFQKAHSALDRNSPTFQRDRADLMNRRQMGKQLGL